MQYLNKETAEAVLNPYTVNQLSYIINMYVLRHDKINIMRLRPAWIQPSLRIRAV
jgi:hypothetical protein